MVWLEPLSFVLSVVAGSADVISFLGLGVFTAHITGNLAILASHVAVGGSWQPAATLSVPMFMLVLGLAQLLAAGCEKLGFSSLAALLLLQFLLLAGFLAAAVTGGTPIDANAGIGLVAALLGVSAMAVQNTLVQYALQDAPPTAVMTSNVTRFMEDVCELMIRRDERLAAAARRRLGRTWPAIVGFTCGCALGAVGYVRLGLWSLALPAGLALVAFALGLAARRRG